MSKLSDEQIEFIEQQVNNSQIESVELKEDLIDHFSCVIEEYMDQGRSFEDSYNKAYQIICPNGFDEIYKETLLLLTSKNIIVMKKSMYILGFIAAVLWTTSILFKLMHWPGAAALIILGAFMLIFVLLPIIALYFYKKEFSQYISYKLKYVFGFVGLGLFLTGIVGKIMHWPGWGIILVLSVVLINFGFLPFLFYRMYKKSVE
ncbi:MAG: hypothetical protein JSV24_01105 [Bacteroidales bacterium]|nr:MAG: hypothetical protein JSV24_01105 [Bacteroidales bacterium]